MRKSEVQKILLKEKENLVGQIKYYKSEDPFLAEDRDMTSTLDDDITENEGHDRIEATKVEMERRLVKVNSALERLEKGKYGKCVNCGAESPEERLVIMPSADLCISCETGR